MSGSDEAVVRLQTRRRASARDERADGEALEEASARSSTDESGARCSAAGQPNVTAVAETKAEAEEHLLAEVRAGLDQFRQRSAELAHDYLRVLSHTLPPTR